MAYPAVLWVLGWALLAFSIAMLVPAFVGLGYGEFNLAQTFVVAAGITAFIGGALTIATKGTSSLVSRREGFLLAVLIWSVIPVFGALPFYFGEIGLTATDAYFESVSALTTTGATVVSDLDNAAKAILLWRSLMQWIGGLGVIILAIGLLSLHELGGTQLYRRALPLGEYDSLPIRLKSSVAALWWIYASLTVLCAVMLWVVEIPAFEAVCIAFSTLSTGGFTTRDGSIAAFDNPIAELILIVFMLAAAVNFTLHWAAAHGRWRFYREDPEIKGVFIVVAVSVAILMILMAFLSEEQVVDSLRSTLFLAVSFLTTTGYTGSNATILWATFVPVLLFALMLVGGSTGSTAGGLKIMRFSLLFKEAWSELARLSHPHVITKVRYGQYTVTDEAIRATWSYFIFFMFFLIAIMLALAASGLDIRFALTASAAALSNTGPALDLVSGMNASYSSFTDLSKWVLCLAMIVGRLELLAFVVLVRLIAWHR